MDDQVFSVYGYRTSSDRERGENGVYLGTVTTAEEYAALSDPTHPYLQLFKPGTQEKVEYSTAMVAWGDLFWSMRLSKL